jgi:hypothetical protein
MLWRLVLPVELARRERVFWTGEAFGVAPVKRGEGEGCVKLVLLGSLSLPVRRSLGNDRRFSSIVEAGEAERGESTHDMDAVRWFDERKVAKVSSEVVAGWFEEQSLCEAIQTPVTSMNRRKASSVWIGICSLGKKESKSIVAGVSGVGVCTCQSEPGVGGDVADGIVYESMTSMRLRVMVAMIGCRLELALMVLNVYFFSSWPGGNVGDNCEDADMPDTRREWAGFSTHLAFRVKP